MQSLKKQLTRTRTILLVSGVVIIALIAFTVISNRNKQTPLAADSLTTVQKRTVEQVVSVDGNLAGVDERDVFVPAQAKLTEIDVVVGQHANSDSLIGRYDLQAGAITKSYNINAPIDGVVSAVNFHSGDTVASPATPLFHMIDTSSFTISLNVNENDIPALVVNQTAKITIPAVSLSDTYDGTVSYVAPAPNSTSGTVTYQVKVTSSSLPAGIKPGMSASVDITTARVDNVLSIPESFLIEQNGKEYVKLVQWQDAAHTTYTITQTEVAVGLKTDQYVEIKSGLSENDELLEPSFTVQRTSLFGV